MHTAADNEIRDLNRENVSTNQRMCDVCCICVSTLYIRLLSLPLISVFYMSGEVLWAPDAHITLLPIDCLCSRLSFGTLMICWWVSINQSRCSLFIYIYNILVYTINMYFASTIT